MTYYPKGHPAPEWKKYQTSIKELRKRIDTLAQRQTLTSSMRALIEKDIDRMELECIPLRASLEKMGLLDPGSDKLRQH